MVVGVGEVGDIFGTRNVGAPEGATDSAFAQAGYVDVEGEAAILEGVGEVGCIDVVSMQGPDDHREIVMTI